MTNGRMKDERARKEMKRNSINTRNPRLHQHRPLFQSSKIPSIRIIFAACMLQSLAHLYGSCKASRICTGDFSSRQLAPLTNKPDKDCS